MTTSDLESAFDTYWRMLAPSHPAPVAEHRPIPARRWRIDRAWPDLKIAVELEGGVYSGGRHTRGAGYEKDLEKYNAMTVAGWRILRYSANQLQDNPDWVVTQIVTLIRQEQAQLTARIAVLS